MAERKSWDGRKKRRTRAHVLADLSANFVERHVLSKGHSVERVSHDYGIDLLLLTYSTIGEIESGDVKLQLKATDHLPRLRRQDVIPIKIEMSHLWAWWLEPMPVILVVYDGDGDGRAFWLYVQNYLTKEGNFKRFTKHRDEGRHIFTFHIPIQNQLDGEAIETFRRYRDNILAQVKGHIGHESREDHLSEP